MRSASSLAAAVRRLAEAWAAQRETPGSPDDGAGQTVAQLVKFADRARDERRWQDAIRFYRAAIDAGAEDDALHVQLGHALKETNEFGRAEAAYRVFLNSHPDDPDIHLQLGHLYNKQGDRPSALYWYRLAGERNPGDADIEHHLERTRRALSRRPVEAKRQRVQDLVAKRAWEAARALLRELVLDHGEDDLIGLFANVTKECGAFDEALALYHRYRAFAATQARQMRSDVELQAGHLYQAMGDLRRALHHYALARRYDFETDGFVPETAPSNRELRLCIGEIYPCFWTGL